MSARIVRDILIDKGHSLLQRNLRDIERLALGHSNQVGGICRSSRPLDAIGGTNVLIAHWPRGGVLQLGPSGKQRPCLYSISAA